MLSTEKNTSPSPIAPPKTIALLVTDTMADWEYAYITTEITRAEHLKPGRFHLLLVGESLNPVRTLGGFVLTPDITVDDLSVATTACCVLPGADTYATGHDELHAFLSKLLKEHVPVAAICGATLLLARWGMLDHRLHTSDSLGFLLSTGYHGSSRYRDVATISDDGITTASGTRPVQFSAEVFRRIGLYPDPLIDAWLDLNLTNSEEAFFTLQDERKAFANS